MKTYGNMQIDNGNLTFITFYQGNFKKPTCSYSTSFLHTRKKGSWS